MSGFLQHFRQINERYTVSTTNQTRCPYCSMQCTMLFHRENTPFSSRFTITPNKEDSIVQGRMCVKGLEAHTPIFTKERITSPLLRRHGTFIPVSWRTALQWLKRKVRDIQKAHGFDAIGVYGGGSLTNEEGYLLGKFARVALRTRYIDYNGRYCMSAAAAAGSQAFGIDRGMTNPLADIPLAKCIILAGTNIAECQPTMMPYLRQAKANGACIIAIDPRATGTTRMADVHLQPKPGTDAALVNGMLKVIIEEGYYDSKFITAHTVGWEEMSAYIRTVQMSEVSHITGIPEADIVQAARIYGQAESGMVFTARGVEQHAYGVQNVRNFINLALVTGKIGKPGSGYGAVTGQANGQGGREHGQKADQLPGYRSIENAEHRRHIAEVWGIKESRLPGKGVSAYEMMERAAAGELEGMIVLSSNPVVSNPNARFVEEVLRKLPLLVVVDLYMSETAQLADLILPCVSYLEKEGTVTNLEGRVMLRKAVQPPPGEARPDWRILQDIAHILGQRRTFRYGGARDIFEELRKASRGGVADYSGIKYERIEKEQGVFWPCADERAPGTERLFEEGVFYHPDGRARLAHVPHLTPPERTDDVYPVTLTTGRLLHHYNSGVQTRRTPALYARAQAPVLQIHPETAERLRLVNGARARIHSKRETIEVDVRVSKDIREDTVFVAFHWGDEQCINRLTLPELDPQCRMPSFKACAVRIEPVESIAPTRKEQKKHEQEKACAYR